MNYKYRTLIIVPAYNEEECIKKVLEEIRLSSSYDIVVINDGSNDNTDKIVKSMNINVLLHPINLGVGAAIQTGLRYAFEKNYDAAIVIDGDGQHDPGKISKFIDVLQNHPVDVVVGSRFLSNIKVKTHWARRIGIRLFSKVVSFIARCKITDVTSGYRAFNGKAMDLLVKEMPSDFPDADILLFLALSKYKIVEIPVNSKERTTGKSMYSLLKSIYYPFKMTIALTGVIMRRLAGNNRGGY